MHVRELAEVALLAALYAPRIVQSGEPPLASSQPYWAASKCRLDRWARLLRQLLSAAHELPRPATLCWTRVRPVLEEILISELLTRIWSAVCAACDRVRADQELEPVARSILLAHLDARRRLLALLADGRVFTLPQALHLNQLRRRTERWNDMLLAHLADITDVEEFAFEGSRMRDFAEDLDYGAARADRGLTCRLMLLSLRSSFAHGLADYTPNSDLNRRIGSAVLTAFRDELFDAVGLAETLWLERLHRTASETEGMIDELLCLEQGHRWLQPPCP